MGHVVFVVLHLIALLFMMGALLLTIPLHVIYAVLAGRSKPAAAPASIATEPQRTCPACAEPVQRAAFRCKHCGVSIVAEEVKRAIRENTNLDGLDEIEVVGESHYQATLRAIEEAHQTMSERGAYLTASLIREPENRFDKNAVRVEIAGYTVGYLARHAAAKFERACRREFNIKGRVPTITTPAELRGKDLLGVFLYVNEGIAEELAE